MTINCTMETMTDIIHGLVVKGLTFECDVKSEFDVRITLTGGY